jgi:hypothetical protein
MYRLRWLGRWEMSGAAHASACATFEDAGTGRRSTIFGTRRAYRCSTSDLPSRCPEHKAVRALAGWSRRFFRHNKLMRLRIFLPLSRKLHAFRDVLSIPKALIKASPQIGGIGLSSRCCEVPLVAGRLSQEYREHATTKLTPGPLAIGIFAFATLSFGVALAQRPSCLFPKAPPS